MHGDRAGGAHDDPKHGPEVVDRSAKPFNRVLGEVGARLGVIVPEFATVIVEPFLLQQMPCARVMKPRVVEDDQTRVPRQICPLVVVTRSVAKLIDDEIVGLALVSPDKIVGGRLGEPVDREDWIEMDEELVAV